MDAVQHFGSYGNKCDKLEIMGLLTPYEEECDSVLGDLTAEDVFERINKHHKGEWEQFIGSLSVEDDTEAPWLDDSISREYPMSPKEFAKKMTDISDKLRHPPENDPYYDEERCHAEMDDLMSDLLVALGYAEGIEIFNNTDKWYS